MPLVRAIFNPLAAGGRNASQESDLRARLNRAAQAAGYGLEWTATQAPGHAGELAAAADGCQLIAVIGGDGTVNEVVNGLMGSNQRAALPSLGVIPVGSGNDFAWSAGISLDTISACQRLFSGRSRRIDVGHVREADGRERYFVNGCGAGFDAQAALEVERLKWLPGFLIYLVAVLKTLVLHHQIPLLRITLDGQEWMQPSMMLTVGNGRRLGGGFLVTPDAELDDGWLDVCIAGQLSRLGILMVLPRFMRGTHVTHPQVQMRRARNIQVQSSMPLAIHLDGESFATDAQAYEYTIEPDVLELRV
jgi:YegS/Rv2252/BmrU family lipid kinase